jgi:hypothetical protein
MTFRRERGGLLTPAGITRVLDKEKTFDSYQEQRGRLRAEEPYLDTNLVHWLGKESKLLKTKIPALTEEDLNYVAYLLERYFVRGFLCKEEAINTDLQQGLKDNKEKQP